MHAYEFLHHPKWAFLVYHKVHYHVGPDIVHDICFRQPLPTGPLADVMNLFVTLSVCQSLTPSLFYSKIMGFSVSLHIAISVTEIIMTGTANLYTSLCA